MMYILAVLAIAALAFLVFRLTLIGRSQPKGTADEDVTGTGTTPPAHPTADLPGSDRHRAAHDKP